MTIILKTVVGSTAFGTSTESSDNDLMGIFTESPDELFSPREPRKTIVNRTKPEGVRSGPDDVDEVIYTLRHYLKLALKGNPHVMTPLFVDREFVVEETQPGTELRRSLPPMIASKDAYRAFAGYMHNQARRFEASLDGEKLGHMPSRPELVSKFGYDTKYAAHILRLGWMGAEFLKTGRITLPMEGEAREDVMRCRFGDYSVEGVLLRITEAQDRVDLAYDESPLPNKPDIRGVEKLSMYLHTVSWGWSARM